MATGQTHCPSCSEELAGDQAPTEDGQPLICSTCRDAVSAQRRGKWKPVMQWETSLDGFRLASRAPVPWKSPQVALIRVARGGEVTTARTLTGKRELLSAAMPSDLVLAAWPGQYRQDVFLVDDRKAARNAVG